jgi:hypothetical protein
LLEKKLFSTQQNPHSPPTLVAGLSNRRTVVIAFGDVSDQAFVVIRMIISIRGPASQFLAVARDLRAEGSPDHGDAAAQFRYAHCPENGRTAARNESEAI